MNRRIIYCLVAVMSLLTVILSSCSKDQRISGIFPEPRIGYNRNVLEFAPFGGKFQVDILCDNNNIAGIFYGDLMTELKRSYDGESVYTAYWDYLYKKASRGDFIVWEYCDLTERPTMLAKGVKMMNEQDFWSGTKCKFNNLQFERTASGLTVTMGPNESNEEQVFTVCLEQIPPYINDMILIRQQGSPKSSPEQ